MIPLLLAFQGARAGDGRRLARSGDQGAARRGGRLGPHRNALPPTTAGTQIFTIVYILTGFGVLVALLTSVAQQYLKHKTEPRPARARRRGRRGPDTESAVEEVHAAREPT